jgi:hypothetical protein
MAAHPLDQAVFGAVLPEAFGPISLEYLDPADDPRNP